MGGWLMQGSLRGQLDLREKGLGWAARVNVALGAALGLAYLHDQAEPPVSPCSCTLSHMACLCRWTKQALC